MSIEEIKQVKEEYDKGLIHWITLAKVLAKERDQGTTFDQMGIFSKDAAKLIHAYHYLQLNKPEVIENPEIIKGSFRTIAYLPHISSLLSPETRDQEISDLLNKIIKGEYSTREIERFSVSLKGKTEKSREPLQPQKEEPSITLEESELAFISQSIDFLTSTLNLLLKKYDYSILYQHHAKKCDELATILRCISDPDFRKMWEERKEINI